MVCGAARDLHAFLHMYIYDEICHSGCALYLIPARCGRQCGALKLGSSCILSSSDTSAIQMNGGPSIYWSLFHPIRNCIIIVIYQTSRHTNRYRQCAANFLYVLCPFPIGMLKITRWQYHLRLLLGMPGPSGSLSVLLRPHPFVSFNVHCSVRITTTDYRGVWHIAAQSFCDRSRERLHSSKHTIEKRDVFALCP